MRVESSSNPWREVGAMLAVAVCLGFAYNASSPLGIRQLSSRAEAPTASPYSNETLNVAVESPQSIRQVTELTNDTVSVEVAPGDPPPPAPNHEQVSWPEVKVLLAGGALLLVDARGTDAFAAGHIPGAVSLPFTELEHRIAQFTALYPVTTPIVVYCADTQCPVSTAEARQLREQYGYGNVREMPGGYVAWRLAEGGAPP